MTPHIIFLDVDGTLVNHGTEVADSTVRAVRAARSAGHLVYLCTGRAGCDIHPDIAEIGFDGAITNGGVTARSGSELVISRLLSEAEARRLIDALETHDMHYYLQTDDEIFASPGMTALMDEHVRSLLEREAAGGVVGPEDSMAGLAYRTFRDVEVAPIDRIAKAVFASRQHDGLEVLGSALGDDFHIVPSSVSLPGGSSGEVCLMGTNKGSAIELLLAHLGIDAADSVGVGDSWNDVEMFEVCGTSVAMGNAEPELKRLADHVTTSVTEDGVWHAFHNLGLLSACAPPRRSAGTA